MPYKDPVKQKDYMQRYMKERYLADPEDQKRRSRESKERRRKEIQKLKEVPCVDCKQSYPSYAMSFDHVRGEKSFTIGEVAGSYSTKRILEEVAKTDIVCLICHARRTHKRGYSFNV